MGKPYNHHESLRRNVQFALDERDATLAEFDRLRQRLKADEENLAYCRDELAAYEEEEDLGG